MLIDEIEPLNEANGELAGRPQSQWAHRWWRLGPTAAFFGLLSAVFLTAGPQGLKGQGLRGVLGLRGRDVGKAWTLLDAHMERKEPSDLTRAREDDDIEVYYIMRRLTADVDLFHSDVWFKNSRTGLDSTVQFHAKVFGPNLVTPTLNHETHQIIWNTSAIVVTTEGQLDSYWTKRERVATIKGNHYNQYIKWVEGTANKYTNFNLFNLATKDQRVAQPHFPDVAAEEGFPPGSVVCSDIAQLVLQEIKDLAGVEAFSKKSIERSDVYLLVKPGTLPRKLDMTPGSPDFEVAWKFFDALDDEVRSLWNWKSLGGKTDLEVVLEKFLNASTGLTSAVYVDANREYWSYTPDEDQFIDYYLTDAPMYQP